MKQSEIKKAETLLEIINTMQPEPLDETTLPIFYYDNTMPIRMGNDTRSPIDDLFEDCTMLKNSQAYLLSGHRACGKSTELFNLKRRLEAAGQPAYIIRSSIEMNLSKADCWDIMLFIIEGLCHIADRNGIKLPKATLKAVFDYIKKDIEVVESKEYASEAEIGAVFKLLASIKANLRVGAQARTNIKEQFERRASEWLHYVNEISDIIASRMNGKRPVLIFEDLDKIQPNKRALDIFQYDVLASLPFPVIYTFPISVTYDPKYAYLESFYKVSVLPMIKVTNLDKGENEDGIEVLRRIVGLRADLKLFEKNALTELIKQTGGVLRHLFECIIAASRNARRRGAKRIELEDSQWALSDLSTTLRKFIEMEDNKTLRNIYNDPKYRKQVENRELLSDHMRALIVLEYQNGDRWHDLHPQIARFLKDQGVFDDENQ